jgi:hypothetical protein
MSSSPTWVEEDLKAFFKILFLTYEVKPYKPKKSTNKFECQASSRDRVGTRVIEVYKKQSM